VPLRVRVRSGSDLDLNKTNKGVIYTYIHIYTYIYIYIYKLSVAEWPGDGMSVAAYYGQDMRCSKGSRRLILWPCTSLGLEIHELMATRRISSKSQQQ
jgi:hypothetical protein